MKKSLIFHKIIIYSSHSFQKKKSLNFIFLEILNIYTVYTLFLLKIIIRVIYFVNKNTLFIYINPLVFVL